MFLANRSSLLSHMKLVYGNDTHAYSQISLLNGRTHFYLVDYEQEINEQKFRTTTLLDNLGPLAALKRDPKIQILSLLLASAGQLNGSGRWQLDPLKAVWQVERSNDDRAEDAVRFDLQDGRCYWDGPPSGGSANLVRLF